MGFFSALPKEELITPVLSLILANFPGQPYGTENAGADSDTVRKWQREDFDFAFTNAHCEEDWGDCRKMVFQNLPVQVVVSMYHPWALKNPLPEKIWSRKCF